MNRTLAELNVRGKTGATILAITRVGAAGAKVVIPSGKETIRVGDVLALAGTQEAVEGAIEMLSVSRRARGADAVPQPEPVIPAS